MNIEKLWWFVKNFIGIFFLVLFSKWGGMMEGGRSKDMILEYEEWRQEDWRHMVECRRYKKQCRRWNQEDEKQEYRNVEWLKNRVVER